MTDLNGLRSMNVKSFRCCKKEAGVSEMTCNTFMRVYSRLARDTQLENQRFCTFRYSTNLFKNATKCSALLMLPGTASLSKSSGRTGLAMKESSLPSSTPRSPSTNFWYSFCNFVASLDFKSTILFSRFCAPRAARRRESSVKSMLRDSMHTLSDQDKK